MFVVETHRQELTRNRERGSLESNILMSKTVLWSSFAQEALRSAAIQCSEGYTPDSQIQIGQTETGYDPLRQSYNIRRKLYVDNPHRSPQSTRVTGTKSSYSYKTKKRPLQWPASYIACVYKLCIGFIHTKGVVCISPRMLCRLVRSLASLI